MSGQYFPGVDRIRRRGLIVRVVVLVALVALLVLVVSLWPKPERGGLRVAAVAGSVEPSGVLRGTLAATRDGESACYSVTVRGTRSVLRFVGDWSAQESLALVDPAGAVVAQPDATAILIGRPAAIGSVAGCDQVGRIWTITSVRLPAS